MRPLRIAIVTGIYPPDIGGPATHAHELATELRERGFEVTVVTLSDGLRSTRLPEFVAYPRRWPWLARGSAVVAWLVRHRRDYDVVYATGMQAEAVVAARAARRPVVVKIVCDPAWERARRQGLTELDFEAFQRARAGSPRIRAMCLLRRFAVRYADVVVAPSRQLAAAADGWTARPGVTEIVRNGATPPPGGARRTPPTPDELRAVYVGRLAPIKGVDVLIRALQEAPQVRLDVVGEGPERSALERLARACEVQGRVRFVGRATREEVMAHLADAHVLVTAASFEGLPHTAVEALMCSTPVIASAAGGTAEVVIDGLNGFVIDPGTPEQFSGVLVRLRDDGALLSSLTDGAEKTAPAWRFELSVDRLVELFSRAAGAGARRPPVVFVGKTVAGGVPPARKIEILKRHLDVSIVAGGPLGMRRAEGVRVLGLSTRGPWPLSAAKFYVLGPLAGVLLAAGRRPSAVVCQSPYEGLGAVIFSRLVPAGLRPRIVIEVHGDWRTAARCYGGRARRPFAPFADAAAMWSLRRADRVRAVGSFTEALTREAGYAGQLDSYVAFSNYDAFLGPPPAPLSGRPQVAFVGVLQEYKAPQLLIEAWSVVTNVLPGARLVLAGEGPLRQSLEKRCTQLGLDRSVRLVGHLDPPAVASLLDASWCVALPSVSEGHPRILIEAMSRARPVVATSVGGIPELVLPGETGLLVTPGDAGALANALLQLLCDRRLAGDLGRRGRQLVEQRDPLREFEGGTARLAAWIADGRSSIRAAGPP